MNETSPELAIAILRGSTKEHVSNLLPLESIVRNYADAKHFNIRYVFEDLCPSVEKIPFLQREVVAKALGYCREYDIRHIIVPNIDHSFRDVEDCSETIRIITNGESSDDLFSINMAGITGTAIHVVENGIDSRDEQCLLILKIRATCAAEATRKRSARHKEAFTAMRKTGQRTGAIPYGWDAVVSTRISQN